MSQIDLFLPNIAIGAISCAIASITTAFIVAILLQSIYELGLRKYINTTWLYRILKNSEYSWSEAYRFHRGLEYYDYVEQLCREHGIDRISIIKTLIESLELRASPSLLSLSPSQLSGQISVMLDQILMDTLGVHLGRKGTKKIMNLIIFIKQ